MYTRCVRLLCLALIAALPACTGEMSAEREREAEKQVKESLGPDIEAIAVAQPIDEAVAKEVQQNLTTLHEYQGELSGKFDAVTVNAIQAFQRTAGLKDNGIVDAHTRERLQAAATESSKAAAPPKS